MSRFWTESASYPKYYVGAISWSLLGNVFAELESARVERHLSVFAGNPCDGLTCD